MIPYGKQTIEEDDIQAVAEALRSPWLTQGPLVEKFERKLVEYCGARYAVAVANGTVALQAAYAAAGLGPGDEFVTSPLTFAATASAGVWLGAKPVFADIDPETGALDPEQAEAALTPRTKALVPVDYAGNPADYGRLRALARAKGLILIADACQSLGASFGREKAGAPADMTALSFHPVKSITTGEGGAVLTSDEGYYRKLKQFRHHGIVKDGIPGSPGDWYHEMRILGTNGRLTDIQCALGISQLAKLDRFIARRREIARRYTEELSGAAGIALPKETPGAASAWHLYPVRVARRDRVFNRLRDRGIGVQVHYIPVFRHPYYREHGYAQDGCPNARAYSDGEISLPIFPLLTDAEQAKVIAELKTAVAETAESL